MGVRLVVAASTSLDGVMQAPASPDEDRDGDFRYGGWMLPYVDAGVDEAMAATFAGAGSMLLGRRTHDILAAFWPTHPEEPGAEHLNALRKYVVTRRGITTDWHNTEVLHGDAALTVEDLKARETSTIVVQGSTELIRTLAEARLVDEVHLFVFPVVLGAGKRFMAGPPAVGLRLLRSSTSQSGVVSSAYAVEH
ncbi:dihydrofolate reductase family protein [Nocardioides currus]|uniref:Deaminase n=1 Tax=Nocardioides currus TaxID=2133958 RepID=A0A2R7YV66_9ACTN|nr:dihydrofolate reductase family protein [Nocardioides currus]PUA80262.1 deaminase [Nocardioides currus]